MQGIMWPARFAALTFQSIVWLALCGALIAPAGASARNAGDLDPSFGDDGVTSTEFGRSDSAQAVAIDSHSHHRIVTAGVSYDGSSQDFALARYKPNGTLDPSFGGDGKVTTDLGGDDVAAALAIDSRKRIVVAGQTCQYFNQSSCDIGRFALARYKPSGTLDPSFGTGGAVTTQIGGWCGAHAVAIGSDGRIVAAGYSASGSTQGFALARYGTDGHLDPSFGDGGAVTTPMSSPGLGGPANAVAIDNRGRLVVAGYGPHGSRGNFASARYWAHGELDRSFSGNGRLTMRVGPGGGANSVAIGPRGRIVVAGGGPQVPVFALARFKPGGRADRSFGSRGKVVLDFGRATARSVAIDSRRRIVVAGGGRGAFALARFRADGGLDRSFGRRGKVRTPLRPRAGAFSAAIDTRDRIVAAGDGGGLFGHSLLARYIGYQR
jgi:uncharacterized delta-60 repeat protein